MKVIHVPFCFYPDPVGGTEVYVEGLVRELQRSGVEAVIVAPGVETSSSVLDGLLVRRFAVSDQVGDVRTLYGGGDARASAEFAAIVDDERPDIVHLHAFTSGVSLRVAQAARHRGARVVFTYHTPTISCQRGTLMRWGKQVCDGALDLHACASCTLHGLGASRATGLMLGALPSVVGTVVGGLGLSGGVWTALRMTELIALHHGTFRTLMQEVDHVVALCQWTRDLLVLNGVPPANVTVSRHGLSRRGRDAPVPAAPSPAMRGPLRIAYLGRLDPSKGPDVLIRAVRSLPAHSLELHLFGIVQGVAGCAYRRHLESLAAGDDRIAFFPPIPSDRVVSRLRHYQMLAVPSKLLETGPLVVLEAFAAGIPVIGSDLGGISELIEHDLNGLLVEPASLDGWCQALRRLAGDSELLRRLRAGVQPPRRMEAVADDMIGVYRDLLRRPRNERRLVDPCSHPFPARALTSKESAPSRAESCRQRT